MVRVGPFPGELLAEDLRVGAHPRQMTARFLVARLGDIGQREHGRVLDGDDVPSVLFCQFSKLGVVGFNFGADRRRTGRGFPQLEMQPHPGAQVLRIERLDKVIVSTDLKRP